MHCNGVLASGWDKAPLSNMIYSALIMPPFREGGQYPVQGNTGVYREIPVMKLQGNPCNENRIPAMRTGFPVMKTGLSQGPTSAQNV